MEGGGNAGPDPPLSRPTGGRWTAGSVSDRSTSAVRHDVPRGVVHATAFGAARGCPYVVCQAAAGSWSAGWGRRGHLTLTWYTIGETIFQPDTVPTHTTASALNLHRPIGIRTPFSPDEDVLPFIRHADPHETIPHRTARQHHPGMRPCFVPVISTAFSYPRPGVSRGPVVFPGSTCGGSVAGCRQARRRGGAPEDAVPHEGGSRS